jgi:DNA-binding transcriptional regulator YiaG
VALRRRAGLDQHAVATAVGCSVSTLWTWGQGRRLPQPEILVRLAALHEVAPQEVELLAGATRRPTAHGPVLDGKRLAAACNAWGSTHSVLTERLGISANTVARWESARRAPEWRMWERITATLGVPIADLGASGVAPPADDPPLTSGTVSSRRGAAPGA